MSTHIKPLIQPSPHRKLALFWAIVGALTAVAVLPYALALNPQIAEELPLPVIVIGQPLQIFAVLFLGGWLALRLGEQIGLDSPFARSFVYGQAMPPRGARRFDLAVGLGLVTGMAIFLLERFVIGPLMPPAKIDLVVGVPLWKGFLGSFYGGIAEELLTRLIVMTLVTWLIWRVGARRVRPVPAWTYWVGIVVAGVAFGLGHLPVTTGVWDLTPIVVARILLLNLLPAVGFGYLYWRWGIEHAMLAHFVADLVLRGLGV